MLNIEWIKNENHVSYVEADRFFANFSKETGIHDLEKRVRDFVAAPTKEGIVLKGTRRTTARVFIPDYYFGEHIEMGENPWIFLGEMYPAYCIYGL